MGTIIQKRLFDFLCSETEQKMYREPFLTKFSLFSIRFSDENQTDGKLSSKTNCTQRVK